VAWPSSREILLVSPRPQENGDPPRPCQPAAGFRGGMTAWSRTNKYEVTVFLADAITFASSSTSETPAFSCLRPYTIPPSATTATLLLSWIFGQWNHHPTAANPGCKGGYAVLGVVRRSALAQNPGQNASSTRGGHRPDRRRRSGPCGGTTRLVPEDGTKVERTDYLRLPFPYPVSLH